MSSSDLARLDALQAAAEAARAAGDIHGAAQQYSAALALLPTQPADSLRAYGLYDGRAACLRALADPAEGDDLAHMTAIAETLGDLPRKVAASVRQASLLTLLGQASAARQVAEHSLVAAREAGNTKCEAECLAAITEACYALSDYAAAEASGLAALERFRSLGMAAGEAHILRQLGLVVLCTSDLPRAQNYFQQALALCRALGDRDCEAKVLNALGIAATDYALARGFYEQALAIVQTLNDPETQAILANNLGFVYGTLGLYGQSRSYAERAVGQCRLIGARGLLATNLETLARAYEGLGLLDEAQAAFGESRALAEAVGGRFTAACCTMGFGRVAMALGRPDTSVFAEAAAQFHALGAIAEQATALAWLGAAHLRHGHHASALNCTSEAADMLQAGHISSEFPAQEILWWQYQALLASGDRQTEAPKTLAQAYATMLSGIATLSDAGLRRNYQCRVPINRAIVEAWARGSHGELPFSAIQPPPPNLSEQLTRMLSISARMNEQRDPAVLREMLLDEVQELSGAERVLLLANEQALEMAARGVPTECISELRALVEPMTDVVGRTHQPLLQTTVAKDGSGQEPASLRTRSALSIPLFAGGRAVGALYADMRVAFGTFDPSDISLLSLLATQAATALENARLYRDLEGRVAARTADLLAANAVLEQRAAENARLFDEAQRARAAAEAANAAKSSFLANMSHELRTPLNAVLGFSSLVAHDASVSARQRENLAIIARSGEHLLTLINDVLEMTKIEAGQLVLNPTPFDVRQLFASAEQLFSLPASAKQLALSSSIGPDVPRYAVGDQAKLRQIAINLLGNAVKFTQAGRVHLRLDAAMDAGALLLRFAVEDSGPGIAAEELGTLFQPFVQTASGRQLQEGTGLGLALSRQFARLMGGDITATSALGHGSCFVCEVRLGAVAENSFVLERSTRRVSGIDQAEQREHRILVVDDAWENRRLLVERLSQVGFLVREACDGQQALDTWSAWRPHLVLMDMRMAVLGGEDATRRIKATPQGQTTVVIAVTASALAHERAGLRAAGCDDVLNKPIRDGELFAVIGQHLGLRFIYDAGPAEQAPASLKDIHALLPELRGLLADAAASSDPALVEAAIQAVGRVQPKLAEQLAGLAADFRFEEIEALARLDVLADTSSKF